MADFFILGVVNDRAQLQQYVCITVPVQCYCGHMYCLRISYMLVLVENFEKQINVIGNQLTKSGDRRNRFQHFYLLFGSAIEGAALLIYQARIINQQVSFTTE